MGKCIIKECDSGSSREAKRCKKSGARTKSRFQFPKSQILRTKWLEALNLTEDGLKIKSAVCEAHFDKEDIIKYDVTTLADGTIFKMLRHKYKLREDAVPQNQLIQRSFSNKENLEILPMTITENVDTVEICTDNTLLEQTIDDEKHNDIEVTHEFINNINESVQHNEIQIFETEVMKQEEYTFNTLKEELTNYRFGLPSGWSYNFGNNCIIFTFIHLQRIRLFCSFNSNFEIQLICNNNKIKKTLNGTISSNKSVIDFLKNISKTKCCDGTGVDKIYSENCTYFIKDLEVFEKNRGYQRCNSCRSFRKVAIDKEKNKNKLHEKIASKLLDKTRLIKTLRAKTNRLEKKVDNTQTINTNNGNLTSELSTNHSTK